MSAKYDLIIIGSGPAGHSAALKASLNGLRTLIIEKNTEMIGGVCLNEGCIPAKSLLHNANLCSFLRKNKDMFDGTESFKVNIEALIDRSLKARSKLKKGLNFLLKKHNIELIHGFAKIDKTSPNSVSVTDTDGHNLKFITRSILIASGSSPRALNSMTFDKEFIINSSDAIKMCVIPEEILIIGAGAIGVEFASYYNSLGSKVTLAEMEKSILPLEDSEITKGLSSVFRKRGIKVLINSSINKVEVTGGQIRALILSAGKEIIDEFDKVLIAVGRTPNSVDIGLNECGIKIDEKGYIEVDENLMTNIPGVYAAGDVINTPMLAHIASAEGEFVASILCDKKESPINYDNIPNAVYSEIEVASVGFTENHCKDQNLEYISTKQFFLSNGRAVATDESEGFVKVIVSKEDRTILGAHIIGYKATELIQEFVLARKFGLTCSDIATTIAAHPTFSETIKEACHAADICLNTP